MSLLVGCTSDKPWMFHEWGDTWCCPAGSDEDDFEEGDLIGYENIGCIRIGDDIESGKFINKD